MIKSLRALFGALFILSLFSIAGCRGRGWDDCCPTQCGPCPVASQDIAPCPPLGQSNDGDSIAYMPSRQVYQNPYQNPTPCNTQEANPYCPCDPTFCGSPSAGVDKTDERCFGRMQAYSTCDDCVVDLVQLAPETATVGSPYPIEICITARKECADVVITQTLPCDSEFVKAEPFVCPDAQGRVQWHFDHMVAGETQKVVVWIKPTREGCCLSEATVCACPQLCARTICGQPVICIKKYGPACACLYCPIDYCIEVSNSGSAVARDVVVRDTVPDGLTHSSGYKCLTYQLGDLGPGECRKIRAEFCASKRGMVCNVATVSYCGGPECSAEACTLINQPCVEVTKTGPDWAYICKTVDYTITVTNPGDMVLRNVVIDDVSPGGTTVVEAPGAEICCNRAVWCVSELCPGETQTFHVTLRSQVAGCLVNKVTVTSDSDCGQCTMCAEASTFWKGIAATHMCMVDTTDPICVGDTTIYRICITNRGTADDNNVRLQVKFSPELQPQSVNGPTPGTISGNTVTFEPLEYMVPKQCVEYSICVKGVAPGDASAEATLNSDTLVAPDIDVERTHVY